MPYKTEKIPLNSPFLDKRCKLLPCQKEMLVWWWKQGKSQRELARMFKVSRRLVQFVCMPDKKIKDLQNRADRGGWKQYYVGGESWAKTMRVHRKYKHDILKNTI